MLEEGIQKLFRAQLLRCLYERFLRLFCQLRLHADEFSGADRIKSSTQGGWRQVTLIRGTSRRFATTLPFFAHGRAISGGNTPVFKD